MKRPCEAISQLASERLERDLSLLESAKLRIHAFMCSACRHYINNIYKLHLALKLKHQHTQHLPKVKRDNIKKSLKGITKKP